MSSVAHVPQDPLPIGPRPAPRALGGHLTAWLRANLFASIPSSIMTLLLLFLLGRVRPACTAALAPTRSAPTTRRTS